MKTPTAPQPFKRPRRVDVARIVASGRRLRRGDCYRYATQEAIEYAAAKSPRPALRVVHGILEGRIAHAWVERGGFAYDWQTLALVGEEGRPIPVAKFYKSRKARRIKVYTARQAINWMVKTGHGGPWDPATSGERHAPLSRELGKDRGPDAPARRRG